MLETGAKALKNATMLHRPREQDHEEPRTGTVLSQQTCQQRKKNKNKQTKIKTNEDPLASSSCSRRQLYVTLAPVCSWGTSFRNFLLNDVRTLCRRDSPARLSFVGIIPGFFLLVQQCFAVVYELSRLCNFVTSIMKFGHSPWWEKNTHNDTLTITSYPQRRQ